MNAVTATTPRGEPRLLNLMLVMASGTVAGAVAGFVAGGIGSRLAMRILAVTTPTAQGATTDAGAIVGEISLTGTLFLLIAGSALGVGGGLLYLALRRWLPRHHRGLAYGSLLLALFGPAVITSEGKDFFFLRPAWLAILMFASLFVGFGLLVHPLQSRLEPVFTRPRSSGATALVMVTALLPLVLGGLLAVAVLVLIGSGLLLARAEEIRRLWAARVVDVGGRVVLVALGLAGGAFLMSRVLEILA